MTWARPSARRAFTLIEIMVAIAVFSIIIAAVYATCFAVMRGSQVGRKAAADAQRQRIALHTIEDSMMCIQSFQASPRYYSFIVENGASPILSFASRVPEIFPRNGKFGDFNLRRMTFTLEGAANGGKDLVLRQCPILMTMEDFPDEQKYPLILAHDVKKFDIECWDTNQLDWVGEWNDTNSIPPMLRIALVMGTSATAEKPATEYAVVRAFSVPSGMMPAVVQMGNAGGLPGQPPIPPVAKSPTGK